MSYHLMGVPHLGQCEGGLESAAVRGGDLYGRFPEFALGGPDDAGTEGRWIPSVSVDQYAATLAAWFGVSLDDLNTVFPNLSNFPDWNVGFMA